MTSLIVSPECIEALHLLVAQRCACALQDPEFLPCVISVIEEEIVSVVTAERAAAREACWRALRKAGVPCRN